LSRKPLESLIKVLHDDLLRGESARRSFVSSYGIAFYYAVIGENERACSGWSAPTPSGTTLVWAKVRPRLDGLRGEAQLRELLERMHLYPWKRGMTRP
jgi:hypothetical protein